MWPGRLLHPWGTEQNQVHSRWAQAGVWLNMEVPTACPLLDCSGLWEMTVSLRKAKGSLHISKKLGPGRGQEQFRRWWV